jgi:Raf kinase inhibitor-like YbhB/YbcL family protein
MQVRAHEVDRDPSLAGLRWLAVLAGVALTLTTVACSGGREESTLAQESIQMSIQVNSSAFAEGDEIPVKYTCDGDDMSPPLAWTGVPDGTESVALVSDDPDAPGGTWVHWVYYSIPAGVTEIPERVPTANVLPDGARQGRNDFGKIGYGGPCPPPGSPHRYYFTLYALDVEPELESGATKADLLAAIDGHVLAEGRLMGTYKRR